MFDSALRGAHLPKLFLLPSSTNCLDFVYGVTSSVLAKQFRLLIINTNKLLLTFQCGLYWDTDRCRRHFRVEESWNFLCKSLKMLQLKIVKISCATHLHVESWRTEPFEEENCESGSLDCYNTHQHPRCSIKRFCEQWDPKLTINSFTLGVRMWVSVCECV